MKRLMRNCVPPTETLTSLLHVAPISYAGHSVMASYLRVSFDGSTYEKPFEFCAKLKWGDGFGENASVLEGYWNMPIA